MLKLIRLYVRMLRYRVAVTLLLFFFLGIAFHQKLTTLSLDYLLASVVLFSGYVSATTLNDIHDKAVDAVNHPSSKGRPLITGEATERELYLTHLLAVAASLVLALVIGLQAMGIAMISLLISYLYSLPPMRLSYRTYMAPVILSVAYVFIPYWLGVTVAGSALTKNDIVMLVALHFLFMGRILLKDFRDRAGDALYGKPTFLLRFGKLATCLASLISISIGNALLFLALVEKHPLLVAILELYFVTIYLMGYKLWKARDKEAEQVAIGIGAKMGNGLLLTFLGILVLSEYVAPVEIQILFAASMTAVFLLNFVFLISTPRYAVIGYRG